MLLEIFETLAELRYVDPESIVRGPHDLGHLQDLYTEHNLDPTIHHSYTLLPYIDSSHTEARDFFNGGTCFDPTDERDVAQGRDPFFGKPKWDDFEATDTTGEYNHEERDLGKETLKPLYLKTVWPNDFAGDAVHVDQFAPTPPTAPSTTLRILSDSAISAGLSPAITRSTATRKN